MSNAQVSGGVHVSAEADGEDRTDAIQARDLQRVDVVHGEVCVFAGLQAPILKFGQRKATCVVSSC